MSKARYIWWGYVKAMIRAYTKDATEKEGETSKKERAAVSAALSINFSSFWSLRSKKSTLKPLIPMLE